MNSEELEMSLRAEFEGHLKNVFADMRQEFSQFQEKIEAEFQKHKSQLDTFFQEFSVRLETGRNLDPGFKETVVEHLRLARDEGARITAMAIAEAEEMQRQSAPTETMPPQQTASRPSAGIAELRDAISDITAQDSQGTILKSLVQHAAQFTPRGAFFIIKNEHFVGWRIFNKEGEANEEAVREIFLPVTAATVLGESVRSLSAVESSFGTHKDDAEYLDQIGFGQPERMLAIPLVARGRGVAVLYADYGNEGEQVNVEALETLVRVAGLTVEVLASSQMAKPVQEFQPAAEYVAPVQETQVEEQAEETVAETAPEVYAAAPPEETATINYQAAQPAEEAATFEETEPAISKPAEPLNGAFAETKSTKSYDFSVGNAEDTIEYTQEISVEPAQEEEAEEVYTTSRPAEEAQEETTSRYSAPEETTTATTTDFQFVGSQTTEPTATTLASKSFETVESAPMGDDFSNSFEVTNGGANVFAPEPTVTETIAAAPSKSRFNDRNVDLPIEVSEDERRLHNDARRFARLLVSEIKLYNEQKVREGREAQDLYDRLREAIDRSRDMYDKRVQPPVAAKFDYFHYELVSTLAEGEPTKLGGDYPGSVV